ncbi:MAG: YceI family protein [Bacteroidetes bacterium]|nr:YceI family protein [Bacteroidota bacterium]
MMKTKSKILTFIPIMFMVLVLSSSTSRKEAYAWKLDKVHSSVTFAITHFFTPVEGRFNSFDLVFNFNPDDLATSNIEATINVESIYTNNDRRDSDLRSDTFFDADNYPEIKFKSSKIEKTDENTYNVHGEITIKQTTKNITIPFKVLGVTDHPRRENVQIMGVSAEIMLNRLDYEIGTGNWVATTVLSNEVKIRLQLEVNREK